VRLGTTTLTLGAIAAALAVAAPANAYEFTPTWGYAFFDDVNAFHDPATGRPGTTTQVFPRGQIRDTVKDGYDVRINVFTFTPGRANSQATCTASEGRYVMTPFECRFDIFPRVVSYIAIDFCRLVPGTNTTFDCLERVRRSRVDPQPPPPDPDPDPDPNPQPSPPADRDGDGFDVTKDCDDANPGVWPNARDVPSNGVDEDCSGADRTGRITAGIGNEWKAFRRFTRVRELRVRRAPTGATVEMRCLGRPCSFKLRKMAVEANGRANLKPRLPRRLRVGTTLEIRIVAPRWIGKVMRYKFRRSDLPRERRLCLPPGAVKPVKARRC
jgi:Putative metal-binding motif